MDLISKYDLIEKIVRTESEEVLHQVKHLLEEQKTESWENLDPALKASFNRGLKQVASSKGAPHEIAMQRLRKKHLKK